MNKKPRNELTQYRCETRFLNVLFKNLSFLFRILTESVESVGFHLYTFFYFIFNSLELKTVDSVD